MDYIFVYLKKINNNFKKNNKKNLFFFQFKIILLNTLFFAYLFIIIKPNIRPRIIAISYSNERYQKQLNFNKKSALEVGKVDFHHSYGPNDIDPDFREKNKDILSRKRGNGYWLWKPYFINKTLIEKLNEGDYLIYTDACVLYINSTYQIINILKKKNLEMWMYRSK